VQALLQIFGDRLSGMTAFAYRCFGIEPPCQLESSYQGSGFRRLEATHLGEFGKGNACEILKVSEFRNQIPCKLQNTPVFVTCSQNDSKQFLQ
jgi:hypothetical protein